MLSLRKRSKAVRRSLLCRKIGSEMSKNKGREAEDLEGTLEEKPLAIYPKSLPVLTSAKVRVVVR